MISRWFSNFNIFLLSGQSLFRKELVKACLCNNCLYIVSAIKEYLLIGRIQLLYSATVQDDDLCSLKHIAQAGLPWQIQEVPLETQPIWKSYEEITIEDALLCKGTRIIIPTSQRLDLPK